jgi:hypothetical protein
MTSSGSSKRTSLVAQMRAAKDRVAQASSAPPLRQEEPPPVQRPAAKSRPAPPAAPPSLDQTVADAASPLSAPPSPQAEKAAVPVAASKYGNVPMSNTGLNIPTDLLLRLQIVAAKRKAQRNRGRASVSEIIVELVEKHINELEAEFR